MLDFVFVSAPLPSLRFSPSLSNDAAVAKRYAVIAYYIESKADETLNNQQLIHESLNHIR